MKDDAEISQELEQRFYAILANSYASILLVTDDGFVEFANPAFCKFFGLDASPSELRGLTAGQMIEKIMPAYDNPEEAVARTTRIVSTGKPVRGEEVAMAGGRTCLRDFVPIFIEGKSYGRAWYHQDITERKRIEEKLHRAHIELESRVEQRTAELTQTSEKLKREIEERKKSEEAIKASEAKYRQLYENMMDGYVLVDLRGNIREYNESYRQMTGYAPEELVRLTYQDLTPEKWHRFEQKIIEEQVLIKGYSEIYEKEYRKKDGTLFPVELRTVLLKDEAGVKRGMWAIVRDITERKRIEEEAFITHRERLRMERRLQMGQLSASLSHELNQPLTAILANSQAGIRLIKAGKGDPAVLEEILQDITTDDKRAGDIIRGLRAMVRPDEGEQVLISINDILHETIVLFKSEAIIRNLRVETDLANLLPPIYVNKVQIQQVVINLIMNAAESMTRYEPEERRIIIKTAASDRGKVQVPCVISVPVSKSKNSREYSSRSSQRRTPALEWDSR